MRPIRLLATKSVRKQTPIIVALIFGGAARETSASSVGQKYMKPTPWIAQNSTGQTQRTRPGETAIPTSKTRYAPPQMNEPIAILVRALGSPPARAWRSHNANRNGTETMLASGSTE